MALPFPINPSQTDVKSPIDQHLMDSIRLNQGYLDTAINSITAGGTFNFRVNGQLRHIKPLLEKGYGKRLDGGLAVNVAKITKATLFLERGGSNGALEVDVLKNKTVEHPIASIVSKYTGNTQSIGRLGSPLNTQSINIATPILNTQLISKPKGTLSIKSISIQANGNILYTFTGATSLDDDYQIGDSVLFSGCNDTNNNGEFTIVGLNYDGLPSISITNPLGTEQAAEVGSAELGLYSYTFLSIVNSNFTEGEEVIFSGHTDVKSDGIRTIYKINQGGNNILVKYPNGVTQGGAAGSSACTRWVYSFSNAIDNTHYSIGEKLLASGHSDINNDGKLLIVNVNDGGNNLVVSNTNGVSQAGAAGAVNTLRFIYSMPSNPSSILSIGNEVTLVGHNAEENDGTFIITFLNRFSANNIEIYNELGVEQPTALGSVFSSLKIVSFEQDFSSFYTVDESKVLIEGGGTPIEFLIDEFLVKEINYGGLGEYNIVIYAPNLVEQSAVGGRVASIAKSIFSKRPIIEVENNLVRNFKTDSSAILLDENIDANDVLTMDILQIQEGNPVNLVLTLS